MKKKYDTTFITLGASNHAKSNREVHDYYSTDALAITLLDKHGLLDQDQPYWESAVGGGRLSKDLKRLGYNVVKETTTRYQNLTEGSLWIGSSRSSETRL